MQYKAIVSDFDGTLVGKTKKIHPEVITAIKKLQKNGNLFAIATGRGYNGIIEETVNTLGLNTIQITNNGAELTNSLTNKVVWSRYMDNSVVTELIQLFSENKLPYYVGQGSYLYLENLNQIASHGFKEQFKHIDDLQISNIAKVGLFGHFEQEKEANKLRDKLTSRYHSLNVYVTTSTSGKYAMDIVDTGATKQIGVLEWAKLHKLKPEQIIAVGDGLNDYPLLTAAGVGVAMGNAHPELKKIADFVAPAVSENGIIDVIDRYFY